MNPTPQANAVARQIGYLAASLKGGAINLNEFAIKAQSEINKLGELERKCYAVFPTKENHVCSSVDEGGGCIVCGKVPVMEQKHSEESLDEIVRMGLTPKSDKAFQDVLSMSGVQVGKRLLFLVNEMRKMERLLYDKNN